MDVKAYTVQAACEAYQGLDPRTLRKWCLTGFIKAKKAVSLWFISAKELNKLLGGMKWNLSLKAKQVSSLAWLFWSHS